MNKTMTWVAIVLGFQVLAAGAAEPKPMYEPTEASLKQYVAPEWYQDAKFGIWPIWGPYSVPAYRGVHAAEWYGIWMYCVEKEPETIKLSPKKRWNDYYDLLSLDTAAHHRETYGDPGEFGYHDFVPMWKAEKWDPDAWAQMTADAGAKFLCMMGTFHDGFSLYDSKLTEWDAVDKGPKRDLSADMKRALHARGLKFGLSNHFAWNSSFWKYYHNNGFARGQEKYADLYSAGTVDEAYLKRWWDRTTEMVDTCRPDLYYFDWGWHGQPWIDGKYHERFASYFYNRAIEWGFGDYGAPGVVLNSKFGPMSGYSVRDLERGKMSTIQSRTWQTDTSISLHSWGYSTEDEYYSSDHLIDTLVDIVSKNGILMLAFGPRADGTVPDEYHRRLMDMGRWLRRNGEAVYATRPFYTFGEGPSPREYHPGHPPAPATHELAVRYTRNKDNNVLYATMLRWSEDPVLLKSLTLGNTDADHITSIQLLGHAAELPWRLTEEGLHITLPSKPDYDYAYPIRIEMAHQLPAGLYTATQGIAVLDSLASYSLAVGAEADSPDEVPVQNHPPSLAIDGKLDTYWDDIDDQPEYRLRVTLQKPTPINTLMLYGYEHHDFAPRNFTMLCDGKKIGRVENAQYTNNQLILSFPSITCSSVELVIDRYYGGSPAVRELSLFHLEPNSP